MALKDKIQGAAKRLKTTLTTGVFMLFQAKIILETAPVAIIEKSRRVGATWSIAYRAVRRGALNMNPRAPKSWFSSADDTASEEYIDYVKYWCRRVQVKAEDLGEVLFDREADLTSRCVRLSNGHEIHALTSNSKQFRSKGGDGYVDEYAHHDRPKDMYQAVNALKMWGGSIMFLSTHNGPNSMFNRLCKKAAVTPRWAHHKITIHDALAQGMLDKILEKKATKAEVQAFLKELREDALDEDTWQQEYLCVPTDESTSLLSYDLIDSCSKEGLLVRTIEELRTLPGNLYAGWDVARKKDLSVLWVDEEVYGHLFARLILIFRNRPFSEQKAAAYQLLDLPNLRRMAIDGTGMGIVLAEQAQEKYGPYRVESVTFTNPVKERLAMGLKADLEDGRSYLPVDFDVREDLHSVKKVVSAGGNVRLEADDVGTGDLSPLEKEKALEKALIAPTFKVVGGPKNSHADRFWAKALARDAARSPDTTPPFMASRARRQKTLEERSWDRAFTTPSFRKGGYDRF